VSVLTKHPSIKFRYTPCKEQTKALRFLSKESGVEVGEIIHNALDSFLDSIFNDESDSYIV
jgi:hypothetical protein